MKATIRFSDAALLLVAGLAALAAFAFPFWMLLGVLHWHGRYAPAVCGALGAIPVLGLAWLMPRRARRIRPAEPRPPTETERLHVEQVRAARVEQLAADPQWSRWAIVIRRSNIVDLSILAGYEKRYQQLLADPERRHHAPALLEGGFRSDRQLDYADDRTMLCTCVHLQPLERALRDAGMRCSPEGDGPHVRADVTMNFELAKRLFALPACVAITWYEPNPHAFPVDRTVCTTCGSSIESGDGPRFPTA